MKLFGHLSLWLVPVALGLAVAPVQSQETDEALWAKLDFNPDGTLDGKELEGGWLKFDANGDKEVTKAEFLAGRAKERKTRSPEEAAKVFEHLDVTGNGFLTGTELDAENARAFDANGDKVVTLEEFVAGYTEQKLAAKNAPTNPAPLAKTPATPAVTPPPSTLKLTPLTPKPGYIMGRAVFANGQPVPRFQTYALGWAGEIHLGPSGTIPDLGQVDGTNGRFEFRPTSAFDRTKILKEALVPVVNANAKITYKDRQYKLKMHPLDGQRDGDSKGGFRQYVSKGVVRDFVLKLHGPKIGYEQNTPPRDTDSNEPRDPSYSAFYGGLISFLFQPDTGGTADPGPFKGAVMTLTFTPNGPLLDGSTSHPIVRTWRIQNESSIKYFQAYFRDIPLGDYTLTATLTNPAGASYPMRLRELGKDYQNSFAVRFEPWDTLASVGTVNVYAVR